MHLGKIYIYRIVKFYSESEWEFELRKSAAIKIAVAASMAHPQIRAHAESVVLERIMGNSPSQSPNGAIAAITQLEIGRFVVS